MNWIKSTITLIIITSIFSSCVSRKNTIYLHNRDNSKEITEHTKVTKTHKVVPGDILYVKILSLNPDITELFNIESSKQNSGSNDVASLYIKGFFVSDSGYIKLPIIDTVKVVGLSLTEAEQKIQVEVDKYFKNSTLIVKLLNFNISILGEVNRPGSFDIFKNEITIFEALARAGGVKDHGNITNILVIRTLRDKNETFQIDLTDIQALDSDKIFLLPNDVVIVEPLASKHFRVMDAPNISLILSAITTMILVLNFVIKN